MKTFKRLFTGLCMLICTLCSLYSYATEALVLDLQAVSTTQNNMVIQYHIVVENSETIILNFDSTQASDFTTLSIDDQTIDFELEVEDPFMMGNTIRVTDDIGVEVIYILPVVTEDYTDEKATMIVETGVLEIADHNI